MLYNFLSSAEKRTVISCNYNQHFRVVHPDRIMDMHDLIYIREGVWSIAQDGIEYDLEPGSMILLQGGHHHYGMKPCPSTVRTIYVHFSTDKDDHVGVKRETDARFWQFPMVVQSKNNRMIEDYFKQVLYACWMKDLYAPQRASAYLDLLFSEISDFNLRGNRFDPLITNIVRKIRATPERFIRAEEFAQDENCSVRTITSKFKENMGQSLHAWQMQQKCQMADELIRSDPTITLKEIAAIFGFYDEYHFGKCYKRIIGHTPKEYIQKERFASRLQNE